MLPHKEINFLIRSLALRVVMVKPLMKEWLYHLLSNDYNITRSPRSFNSQTGVPLSVWQMNENNNLAIFEAGISLPGEMDRLQK